MLRRKDLKSNGSDSGCCPLTKSPFARSAADATGKSLRAAFPKGVAAPALRALAAAGISELEQLSQVREVNLRSLRGMGPKAVSLLREALRSRGMAFLP